MKIVIETIPHNQHRYPTVGDWYRTPSALYIKVSDMGNPHYEFLVALHELVEAWLCEVAGIPEEAVTAFDRGFEKARPEGNLDEPGDDPAAPYHHEHCFATGIERLMASYMKVNWRMYEAAIEELP